VTIDSSESGSTPRDMVVLLDEALPCSFLLPIDDQSLDDVPNFKPRNISLARDQMI